MTKGFILSITDDVVKNLEAADKAVRDIGKNSEKTRDMVNNAFQQMTTGGVQEFINKLTEVKNAIAAIGSSNAQFNGVVNISNQAVQSADSVTTLVETITRLIQVTQNARPDNLGIVSNITSQANSSKEALTDMQKIYERVFKADSKKVSNSAVAHLNTQLEKAQERLTILQTIIGRGFVNTSGIQDEYAALTNRIQKLQQARDIEMQMAQEKLFAAQQEDARTNRLIEQKRREREEDRASAASINQATKASIDEYINGENRKRQATIQRAAEEEQVSINASKTILANILRDEDARAKAKEKRAKAEEKAIAKEEAANKRKAETVIANYKRETEQARNAYLERQRMYEQLFSRWSPEELMSKQGSVKTLNELEAYAKQLEDTMANLDPKSKEWEKLNRIYKQTNREIKSINDSMKDMQTKHKSLLNTADQLKRAFGLMFSVSAIKGYISEIAKVRGEFELQQRSLESILQNKDEANKLWQQTVQLAVRSPFQVKELVTYTKQLAAYRVETHKLYDTTKMLADVSAGLGVDMSRLILAYGQVKAANYLRGTELRQFSEAGVNILGELAKYFTELEGRAVSVGEVFERVSKRMVTFTDVGEIFKRITSEGGIFYNMQEIQADTLKGQISNLRDSIDILLNEIGKDNEGVLKSAISTIRDILTNWREVEYVLKMIISLYAAYKVPASLVALGNSDIATSLFNIGKNGFSATNAMKNLLAVGKGLATAGIGAAVMAIVGVIIHLIRKSTEAARKLKALNKELNQIYTADTTSLKRQIDGFENLVNRLKNVNAGSKEHKDIIGALNQNYGEYLGFVVKESTTYEQMAKSIDKVNTALTNKAKLATFEKAYGKALETNNEIISERQRQIKQQLKSVDVLKDGLKVLPTEKEINDWFLLFEKKVKEENRSGYDLAKAALSEYGLEIEYGDLFNWEAFSKYGDAILRNKEAELKLNEQINNIYGGITANTIEMRQELEKLNKEEETALQKATTRREKEQVRQEYAIKRIKAQTEYEGLGTEEADKRIAALQKKSATIIDVNKKIQASVDKLGASYADIIYIDDEQATQGIDEIAKSAASSYEMQMSLIKSQNKLKEAGTEYDKEILDNATKSAAAYKYLLTLLGRQDLLQKAVAKEENKELTLLNKQIAAIKNANEMYNKLKQTREEGVAKQDVKIAYKSLFEELSIGNILESMGLDESGIVQALDLLPQIAGKKGKEAIEKVKAEFKGKIALDLEILALKDLQREINKKFEDYQLYLELKGIGLSDDVIRTFYADIVDFSQLKEWSKEMSNNLLKYGDKGIEANKNMNDKILEMDRKYAKQRIKIYTKYLMEAQHNAVKIKIEELRKLKELEESKEFTPEQKTQIRERIQKESKAEQQKTEWTDFQNTEMYTMMFEDLEYYGTKALETLQGKLEELRDSLTDLPASDVKEIIKQLNKIEDITIERNPFKALKETRKELKLEGVSKEQAQTNLSQSENEIAKLQQELNIINTINTAKSKGLQIDEETLYAYDDIVVEMADMGIAESDIVATKEKSLKTEKENATAAKETLDNYERQGKARIAALNKTKNILSSIQDATKASMELMDSLGVSSDSVAYSLAEGVDGMISLTLSAVEFAIQLKATGIAANSALGIIGWIAIGIQAVTTAISAIFKMHDAGLQNQIDDLTAQTENLEAKFESLEKAIDKAYSSESLRQAAADAEKYTQQMIANYKAMIELEKQKKKTDEDKIKEYQDAIAEQIEALENLKQDMAESMGAVIDYRSATQDFVDAWLEAYKETSDGLSGLQNKFSEFFEDLIKKQAVMKVTEKFLEPFYTNLNQYLDDYELTKAEMDKLREQADAIAPELSKALEDIWNMLGGSMGEAGKGSLSGLQAGIQGISEDTAQILAAYLNSLRFFVADNNSVIKQLRDCVISTDDTVNPMLGQLRIIAEQTKTIKQMLEDVKSGNRLRVSLD